MPNMINQAVEDGSITDAQRRDRTWEADRKPSTPALAKQPAPTATGGAADPQKVAALVAQSVRWIQTPDGMKRERVA